MIPRMLASRLVYKNRWMRVREDAIEYADGSQGVYGVVEKTDFVLIVPMDGPEFLLIEQYRYPVGGRFAEFPQGSWEGRPEADPLDMAHGELEEETGLRAGRMERIGFLHNAYGFSTQGCHVFLATELSVGAPHPSREEGDIELRRVSRERLEGMLRGSEISDAATVAAYGLLLLRALPGARRST